MTGSNRFSLSRRGLLKAGAAGIFMPAVWTSARAQARQLLIRGSGGPFSHAYNVAFYEPFKQATGVEVIDIVSGNEPISQIKTIVESGANTWDIAGNVTMASVEQLLKDGDFLERHELDDDAVIKGIPPEYRNEYCVGSDVYATAIGYRTDKYKDKTPKNWADFFNVDEFPGRRSMRKSPADTMEIALFADGVAREDIYPFDVDRAFRKLDTIKQHVAVWWTSGSQAMQLAATGEVDMIATWAARSSDAADQGAPIAISYENNIWGPNVWAILKGTPKLELCREFVKFACEAQRQAALAPHVVNGPINPDAFQYIDPDRARQLTTYPGYRETSLRIDDAYWAANRDQLTERFNAWLLS